MTIMERGVSKREKLYWNNRADLGYTYKGERFYTITPIPYYYERRRIIIKKIREYIIEEKCQTVCDFACGDGAYIKQLASTGASFYGVDISETMLELAKKNLKDVNASVELEVSGSGISEDRMFDMIYSSAVWAHIDDSVLEKLVKNIYDHLKKNGLFIICEQTSPYRYGGGGGDG